MPRTAVQPDGLVVPKPAYSPVVISQDLVYTSGQVGKDISGSFVSDEIVGQARKALANVGACLEAAGCGFEDVLKVSTFLANNADFGAYDQVYREFFDAPFPARTTVAVDFDDGTLIEIDAVARKSQL